VTLDGDSFNIQYERLTFSEVGACAVSWQVDGDVHSFDDCDYTVDLEQKTIAVEYFGDPVFHGSVDGNRMTLTDTDDHVAVWRR